MKKVLVFMLSVLMLVSFFAACSKNSNPASVNVDVTVVVTATATAVGPTPTPGTWDDNYPSCDENGNIYFTSGNGLSGSGIYTTKADGTGFQKIEVGSNYRGLEVSENGMYLYVRASSGSATKKVILSNGNPQATLTLGTSSDLDSTYGASWVSNTAKVIYNTNPGTYIDLQYEDTTNGATGLLSVPSLRLAGSRHEYPFGKYGSGSIVYQVYISSLIRYDVVLTGTGRLTDLEIGNNYTPAFNTAATKIIYTNDADGDKDIWTMNVDGTGKAKLFDSTANETMPRYIPGTTKIVYVSDVTGSTKLYTIEATGNTNTIKMISQ